MLNVEQRWNLQSVQQCMTVGLFGHIDVALFTVSGHKRAGWVGFYISLTMDNRMASWVDEKGFYVGMVGWSETEIYQRDREDKQQEVMREREVKD